MGKLCPLSLLVIAAFAIGCRPTDKTPDAQRTPGGSVTLWSAKTELFLEYPGLVVGEEVRFAVHLTRLSDSKPVGEGKLSLAFLSADGMRTSTEPVAPSSPGIFRPVVRFTKPGVYSMTLTLDGVQGDTHRVTDLRVVASASELPDENESHGERRVTFLKEQQWKIDFRTEEVRRQSIEGTVRAACEIVPTRAGEVIVSAPFSGSIPDRPAQPIPFAGQFVERGKRLIQIFPSTETPGGLENFTSRFTRARTEFELKKEEFDRAKRLHEKALIAEKEYREAQADFERAEADYRILARAVDAKESGDRTLDYWLTAPLAGTIVEAHAVAGMHFASGDKLFRIVDARSVWVRAQVSSASVGHLNRPTRAWVTLTGVGDAIQLDERNAKLISVAPSIDPATRTFPVVFEARNPDGLLRIGLFGEISIATGERKNAIAIPESALLEEEGRYSVVLQIEGEEFEIRDVTLGERNGKLVEITSGVREGERIVTTGAYQVRLASLSSQLPAHGHVH